MHLDNPLTRVGRCRCRRWSHPDARRDERPSLIAWRNPYAIIAHITNGLLGILPHAEVDAWLWLGPHEFHGIIQQVFQHFEQPRAIPHDYRQVQGNVDLHATCGDLPTDQGHGLLGEH